MTNKTKKPTTKAEDSESPRMRYHELGTTGLEHWSGRVDEEFLEELKGDKKHRTIAEITENDPIVGAILFAIQMLIRNVNWRVTAASTDEEDEEAAAFLEECMDDMSQSWENTISEILSFLPHGYSYHEVVYKRRLGKGLDPTKRSKHNDGKIGWRKMPIRSQSTLDHWDIEDDGGIKAFWQRSITNYNLVRIPIERSLLFRTTSHKNNPEGRSILRNAFRPWYFKKRIEEIEGIGIERDLAGLPVILAPSKIMAADANENDAAMFKALQNIVRNVRRDEQEGVIMPSDRDEKGHLKCELTLLSTGGTRQFDTNQVIGRYEQRMAMTVLADFILLGHEKVGSFALSSSKTDLFSTAIGAWLGEIKSVFNRFAIPRLFEINGLDLENLPTLEHDDIESPDLKELGEYVSKLSASGMSLFPDDDLEDALRKAASMPKKVEDSEDDMGTGVPIPTPPKEGESEGEDEEPIPEPIPDDTQTDVMEEVIAKVKNKVLTHKQASAIIGATFQLEESQINAILGLIPVEENDDSGVQS